MSEAWSDHLLGEVAEVVGGGTPSTSETSYWGGSIPWITPSEVTRNEGQIIVVTERTITPEGLAASSATLLPEHAVLMTSRATVGAVALTGRPMATNQGFATLVARKGVLPYFLMYWVQANRVEFESRASGSTFPEINRSKVKAVPIRLPTLPVQRRIVDLIGALDAQIEALDVEVGHLVSLLTSLREALVATASWGPVRTMVAPDGVQIGPFGAQLHAHDYTDDGVPVVMPQDIIDGEIHTAKIKRVPEAMAASLARHRLLPGDLVLPRRGDLTKRALVGTAQQGWLCGTGSIRIRMADPALAPALLEGLSTGRTDDWLATHAVGTTMLNLNMEIVSKLPAPIFSTDDRDLAEACVSARRAIKATRGDSNSLRAFRSSLLAALLTGEAEIPESYDALLEAV